MPKRIENRTWLVEFKLQLLPAVVSDSLEHPTSTQPFDVGQCLKEVLDQQVHVPALKLVAFSYSPSEVSNLRENGGAVQVEGFVHSNTVTYIETIIRWIQHPHVLDQHWTPLEMAAGTRHWRQQDAIVQMFSNWDSGRRARVNWLWEGDPSVPIRKGGRSRARRSGDAAMHGHSQSPGTQTGAAATSCPQVLDI